MKKRTAVLVLAVISGALLAAGPPSAAGQGPSPAGTGDLRARVSSIIGRFPAENAPERDALCAEIFKLGRGAVTETCSHILPPGTGDDTKARFAVNGLAVHVTRPGAEAERLLFVKVLIDAIAGSRDKQVAAFFISQVQLTGKAEAVKPLARYLMDEALAGPAAAALQAIGGPEAARVFLKALDAAPPAARITIVDALGEMRGREAVKKLLALAESGDEGLRRASRFALANIGDPAAGPVLSKARIAASYRERNEAPGLYLLFARRLAGSGKTVEGLAVARSVLETHGGPGESQIASEALALIVSVLKDKAVPDLLGAIDSPVRGVRGAALEWGTTLGSGDTTARWVDKAAAAPPDTRAAIIEMLGRRGDRTALPFVRECLRSSDEVVRLAAIPVAARLGGEAVASDIFGLFASADENEAAALKAALLGFDGRRVVPEAVRLLDSTPPPARPPSSVSSAKKGPAARSIASSRWHRIRSRRRAAPRSRPWPSSPAKPSSPASWRCSRRPRTARIS